MVNFFQACLDVLSAVIDYIEYLVTSIWQMFLLIPQAFQMISVSIGVVPTFLTTFLLASITLSIVYLIIGR